MVKLAKVETNKIIKANQSDLSSQSLSFFPQMESFENKPNKPAVNNAKPTLAVRIRVWMNLSLPST